MMEPTKTILFASDSGYLPHLAASIYSLLSNNRDLSLNLVVLTAGISEVDQNKFERIVSHFGVPIKFEIIDDRLFDGLVLNHHFQKSNYYRLFAANLILEDKCLYLDADLIVNRSIDSLLDTDLGDYHLAAVENPGFNRHSELGMHPESKYFNSGVMLINLSKWRQSEVKNAVVSLVKAKPESIHFVDQCGLNAIVDGNWLELDVTYNFQSCMLDNLSASASSDSKIPCIVHFTGGGKPWHLSNKHPYRSLYWRYRNKTPYKSCLSNFIILSDLIRYILSPPVKKILKKAITTRIFL